jgi:CRP-like cAMP-binding protein
MNRLLAALTTDDHDALASRLTVDRFECGAVLHEAGQRLDHVFFPIDTVVSHGTSQDRGLPVESGTVGREGVVSAAALIGDGTAFERAVVQLPGAIAVIPMEVVRERLDRSGDFRELVGAYIQAHEAQVAQDVVCSASHPSEARMARWLLMCLDRIGADKPMRFNNGLLAEVLGIGRPALTVVTGALRTARLIAVERGGISVIDRDGLEDAACDCYQRVRRAFERLLPGSYA